MILDTFSHANVVILECQSPITKIEDVLNLVAACGEYQTDRLLLDAGFLPDSFFDLRTRFAGEFIQKLQTYSVRTAGVFASEAGYSEHFQEFLNEAKRGRQFRVFHERTAAIDWLGKE